MTQRFEVRHLTALAVLAGTAALAGSAQGETIVFGGTGWQATYDSSQDPFVDLAFDGLDDADGDGTMDTIVIQKAAQFFNLNAIIIQFQQTAASNITHIAIEDESIVNSTGSEWTDFHFEVLDDGDAAFNPGLTAASGGPLPLGWYIAPFETYSFSADLTELDLFDTDGDGVDHGESWFPGNGPGDGRLYIDVYSASGGPEDPFTVFTFKETPTIPAPGVLALLGVAGLARSRRRR